MTTIKEFLEVLETGRIASYTYEDETLAEDIMDGYIISIYWGGSSKYYKPLRWLAGQ